MNPAAIQSTTRCEGSDGKRPATSKSRGTCLYYNTSRGCYAGDRCKFLHGTDERMTPFDKNKICKYHVAGYCKRGSDCWFIHADPSKVGPSRHLEPPADIEEVQCAICYDKPVTFGLLGGCSHVFCLSCIRNWRDSEGKSTDMVEARTNKTCPMCRTSSRFVTPSSHFYPDGDPLKAKTIEQYKNSMARVQCKYFQRSRPNNRYCPFGDECFYKHENENGTHHKFKFGADYMMDRHRRAQMGHEELHFDFNESINTDGIGVMLSSVIRALRHARAGTPEMRAVLTSFAAVLGAESPPRLNDNTVTEVDTPTNDRGPASDADLPGIPQPNDERPFDLDAIDQSSEDEDDGLEFVVDDPILPWSDRFLSSPRSPATSTTPEFVPSGFDNMRSLRPGPTTSTERDTSIGQDTVERMALRRASPPLPSTVDFPLPDPSPSSTIQAHQTVTCKDVAVQEPDPFMTDGRGRVVWSSTSREGPRGRAISSSATVHPHPKPSLDIAIEPTVPPVEAPQQDSQMSSSLVRRLVRQRSLPLVGSSTGEARMTDFVTDGRGRVILTHTNLAA